MHDIAWAVDRALPDGLQMECGVPTVCRPGPGMCVLQGWLAFQDF
jgi:hypothetical protein